jgi:hypothetical protein
LGSRSGFEDCTAALSSNFEKPQFWGIALGREITLGTTLANLRKILQNNCFEE